MTLKRPILKRSVLILTVVALAGCGRSGAGDAKSFDAAPPDLKAVWEKAVAADKTNDYVGAVLGYKEILSHRDTLAPPQVKAVEGASGKLYQRLADAATQGDAPAREALATLGAMDRARKGAAQ